MRTKDLRSIALAIGLGTALLVSGCGRNNAPCSTDPSQIESARAELRTAQQSVESARTELAQARQQKTELEGQLDRLPDAAELERRLEILKKGSGR